MIVCRTRRSEGIRDAAADGVAVAPGAIGQAARRVAAEGAARGVEDRSAGEADLPARRRRRQADRPADKDAGAALGLFLFPEAFQVLADQLDADVDGGGDAAGDAEGRDQ